MWNARGNRRCAFVARAVVARRVAAVWAVGLATIACGACGARSSLDDRSSDSGATDASPADASVADGAGADGAGADASSHKPDAAACPSSGPAWSPSVVFGAVTSFAVAADPTCGVSVVVADDAQTIYVMTLRAGAWVREVTPWSGYVNAAASEGSDIHVLYTDAGGLEHASRSAPAPDLVDAKGTGGGELVVDSAGAVHAIYPRTWDGLYYAVKRGTWSIEQVDPRGAIDPTLAIGRDGAVFASWEYITNQEDHSCVVARRGRAGWSVLDPRQPSESTSYACTCRVADDGVLHLVMGTYGSEGEILRHASGTFESPRFETVDRVGSFGAYPWAAAIDWAGALHMAYSGADAVPAPLKSAVSRSASTPSLETVPGAAGVAAVRLVVDGAGVTHVIDFENGQMIHRARWPD